MPIKKIECNNSLPVVIEVQQMMLACIQ